MLSGIKMGSRVPDRWLNYTAFGKRIADTPFIALKCPLKETVCNSLPPEEKFGIEDIKTQLPQVSLIIDLTNTNKYYNPKVLEDHGIEYKKIFTPGHVIPPKSKFYHFFHIVDAFRQNNTNPDKLIGVHCTHGVNRTGLFICSYMISKLGFDYVTAVREFNSARGHEMERNNYLNELKGYVKHPLIFMPGSYEIPENGKRAKKHSIQEGGIRPLMQMPPPLIHPYRVYPGPMRLMRDNGRIHPLMHLPPPIMPPDFDYRRDPRPLLSSSVRFPYRHQSHPELCRRESRDFKPSYSKRNTRRS